MSCSILRRFIYIICGIKCKPDPILDRSAQCDTCDDASEPLPHATCGLSKLGCSPTFGHSSNLSSLFGQGGNCLHRSPWVCHHLSILRRHLSWKKKEEGGRSPLFKVATDCFSCKVRTPRGVAYLGAASSLCPALVGLPDGTSSRRSCHIAPS